MTEQAPASAVREVVLTRAFDAPRETVFEAWTDPDRVAKWWGPEGFDTPRKKVSIDLRVGGRFDLVMVVASAEIAAGMQVELGTEFPERSEIIGLVEPWLLALKSEAQPEIGLPAPTVTFIEFREGGDEARIALTSGPYTETMQPHAEAGWSGSFDKLDALLRSLACRKVAPKGGGA